jgi:hypothetical protein
MRRSRSNKLQLNKMYLRQQYTGIIYVNRKRKQITAFLIPYSWKPNHECVHVTRKAPPTRYRAWYLLHSWRFEQRYTRCLIWDILRAATNLVRRITAPHSYSMSIFVILYWFSHWNLAVYIIIDCNLTRIMLAFIIYLHIYLSKPSVLPKTDEFPSFVYW